jgi:hypothetical protein
MVCASGPTVEAVMRACVEGMTSTVQKAGEREDRWFSSPAAEDMDPVPNYRPGHIFFREETPPTAAA